MNGTTATTTQSITGASALVMQMNLPARGASRGYVFGVRPRGSRGRLGLPLVPTLGYSGKGNTDRMVESIDRVTADFGADMIVADLWDVTLPSLHPIDFGDATLVLEAAASQALASVGFAANVHLTAPRARKRLLDNKVVTPGQLQAAEADARAQVRAWAAANGLTLPPQLRGARNAAALGIAGLRSAAAATGCTVAAPMRRTATTCSHLPVGAHHSTRQLSDWARNQARATLPGMIPVRFPGKTLHASIARSVRHPDRMPIGLGAQTCLEHGWIWVPPPRTANVFYLARATEGPGIPTGRDLPGIADAA